MNRGRSLRTQAPSQGRGPAVGRGSCRGIEKIEGAQADSSEEQSLGQFEDGNGSDHTLSRVSLAG
jgi:hypothetical protein